MSKSDEKVQLNLLNVIDYKSSPIQVVAFRQLRDK